MVFSYITLFPDIIKNFWSFGILQKALKEKILDFFTVDLREYGEGPHKKVDDYPYSGGPGMVLRADVVGNAIIQALKKAPFAKVVVLSASGTPFTQRLAHVMAEERGLVFVCGRYEGLDERITQIFAHYELSLGKFVMMGGELASLVITEVVARLIPGVLGNRESLENESFEGSNLLEAGQYTKPRVYLGLSVPDALLSGNHKQIEKFKREAATEKLNRLIRNPQNHL